MENNLETLTEESFGTVGMDAYFRYHNDEEIPEGDVAVALKIEGLKGGNDIRETRMMRANAIKLMVRFIKHAIVNFEARLADIHGGSGRNDTPCSCSATLTVPADVVEELLSEVEYFDEVFRYEYRGTEDSIKFSAATTTLPEALVPEEIQDDVVNCIEACFDGVFRMSPENPVVVETASNLAMIDTDAEDTHVALLIGSQDEEAKRYLASTLQSVFVLGGARVDFTVATI